MSLPGNGFADAVRSVSRMRQAVAAGTLGAVAACSIAFGAMAAESTHGAIAEPPAVQAGYSVEQSRRETARIYAEYYLGGLTTIAGADLRDLPPREAVLTVKAMARTVLANGPKAFTGEFSPSSSGPGESAIDALTEYLARTAERPVASAPEAQEDAAATARKVRAMLRDVGVDPKETPFTFEGVVAGLAHDAKAKESVLREIVAKARDADYDVTDLVDDALSAETTRSPAEGVLLARLADRFVAGERGDPEERAGLARDRATALAADGALGAIQRLWKEEGHSLDKARVGAVAEVGLQNLGSIAQAFEERGPRTSPGR